jgi:hypothetical protein
VRKKLPAPPRRSFLIGSGAGLIAIPSIARAAGYFFGWIMGPYLGQVATRSFIPSTSIAPGGNSWNSRNAHYARDNIVALKFIDTNWGVTARVGEFTPGGTQTFTRSVEYPAGTFTQAKYSGSATRIAADGETVVSDWIPVTIPSGSLFFSRKWQTPQTALVFCTAANPNLNLALGDAVSGSVGETDKTMSGTIIDNGKNAMIPTAGIVAMTRRGSIVVIGSSRMIGVGDTVVDATGDAGYTRMFGGNFGYINMAISGDSMGSVVASRTRRMALAKAYCSHLWLDPGLNDLNSDARTAAQVMGYLNTLATSWLGGLGRVIINDETAWTSSADGWTTDTQITQSWEAQRVSLNTSIAALTGYNRIVRPSQIEGHGTNNSLWNNPGAGGIQSTTDGVHGSSNDYKAVRDSGIFNPALVHLP